MPQKPWSLYIIQCRDGKLYTGISNDVAKRVAAHNRGKGCRFTRYRHPVMLLYSVKVGTHSEAIKREFAVKRLTRRKKLELIASTQK